MVRRKPTKSTVAAILDTYEHPRDKCLRGVATVCLCCIAIPILVYLLVLTSFLGCAGMCCLAVVGTSGVIGLARHLRRSRGGPDAGATIAEMLRSASVRELVELAATEDLPGLNESATIELRTRLADSQTGTFQDLAPRHYKQLCRILQGHDVSTILAVLRRIPELRSVHFVEPLNALASAKRDTAIATELGEAAERARDRLYDHLPHLASELLRPSNRNAATGELLVPALASDTIDKSHLCRGVDPPCGSVDVGVE